MRSNENDTRLVRTKHFHFADYQKVSANFGFISTSTKRDLGHYSRMAENPLGQNAAF